MSFFSRVECQCMLKSITTPSCSKTWHEANKGAWLTFAAHITYLGPLTYNIVTPLMWWCS